MDYESAQINHHVLKQRELNAVSLLESEEQRSQNKSEQTGGLMGLKVVVFVDFCF